MTDGNARAQASFSSEPVMHQPAGPLCVRLA